MLHGVGHQSIHRKSLEQHTPEKKTNEHSSLGRFFPFAALANATVEQTKKNQILR